MRIESFEVQGATVGCEGCHGNGEAHAEEGDPELIRGFDPEVDSSGTCQSCHARKALYEWPASTHAAEDVGCLDCHGVHTESAPLDTCQTCHGDVTTQFQMYSAHPIRVGKMSCSSCHDPHVANEAMLVNNHLRTNDLCFECHQDKEGPYIFEHAPVQEDCSNCHVPHGTVVNNLLTANEPALCLQCHDFHFHAGYRASDSEHVDVGGIEKENPLGNRGFNIAMTTSCTQCHSHIHGSDTPSQATPGQGRGLTQ
jgi:DmsE family decaheme c-type cytochrome